LLNPYNLEPFQEGLKFTTDLGLTYYLYFTDVSDTFDGAPVYDFCFTILTEPAEKIKNRTDERISHTICKVLDDFMKSKEHVIIYVPMDDEQGKNISRAKLFNSWFEDLKDNFECPNLETNKVVLRYTDDKSFIVNVFYKVEHRAIAEKILYGDVPEISGKIFREK
jgi:hypothetical protein